MMQPFSRSKKILCLSGSLDDPQLVDFWVHLEEDELGVIFRVQPISRVQ